MPLCLVVHDLPPEGWAILEGSIWELSDSHWAPNPHSVLISTGVSPAYLADHLHRALRREGWEGALLTTPLTDETVMTGLPEDGQSWLTEHLAIQG